MDLIINHNFRKLTKSCYTAIELPNSSTSFKTKKQTNTITARMAQNNTTAAARDPLVNYDPEIQVSVFHNDEAAFAAFGNITLSTGPGQGRDAECRICSEEIEADQPAVTHSGCNTSCHTICLAKWHIMGLEKDGKSTCPLCRGEVSIPGRNPQEVADAFANLYRAIQRGFTEILRAFEDIWQRTVTHFNDVADEEVKKLLRECVRSLLLDILDPYWGYWAWRVTFHFEYALQQMKDTDIDSQIIIRQLLVDMQSLSNSLASSVVADDSILAVTDARFDEQTAQRGHEYLNLLIDDLKKSIAAADVALGNVQWHGLHSFNETLYHFAASEQAARDN